MRPVNTEMQARQTPEAIKTVVKFLGQLESIRDVSFAQDGMTHICFCHGNTQTVKRIFVVVDDGKNEGMFIETYKTLRPLQSYDLQAEAGYLYSTAADYIFYLSGNILFTLPTKRFRCWADKSTDSFRKECMVETHNGTEVHHHGFFIPKQRLRQDFARGDVRVSIFRIRNLPNEEMDFVQEM